MRAGRCDEATGRLYRPTRPPAFGQRAYGRAPASPTRGRLPRGWANERTGERQRAL